MYSAVVSALKFECLATLNSTPTLSHEIYLQHSGLKLFNQQSFASQPLIRIVVRQGPFDPYTLQRVACELYRSQSVSVTRIVVSGFTLATHWEHSIVRGLVP